MLYPTLSLSFEHQIRIKTFYSYIFERGTHFELTHIFVGIPVCMVFISTIVFILNGRTTQYNIDVTVVIIKWAQGKAIKNVTVRVCPNYIWE